MSKVYDVDEDFINCDEEEEDSPLEVSNRSEDAISMFCESVSDKKPKKVDDKNHKLNLINYVESLGRENEMIEKIKYVKRKLDHYEEKLAEIRFMSGYLLDIDSFTNDEVEEEIERQAEEKNN